MKISVDRKDEENSETFHFNLETGLFHNKTTFSNYIWNDKSTLNKK